MKTRLNIICIFIFIAITGSIVNFLVGDFVEGFKTGWDDAGDNTEYVKKSLSNVHVYMYSDSRKYQDSIFDKKTNSYLPAKIREASVSLKKSAYTGWEDGIMTFLAFLVLAATIVQIAFFLRLIYVINKKVIFDWSNVVKLRIIGIAMLISFIAYAGFDYINFNGIVANLDVAGYELVNKDIFQFSLLIPGLGILLVAEIFAMGLRLQEEQELTI